jgi:hypothetical protein
MYIMRKWDSVVGIASGYGMDDTKLEVEPL